MTKAQSVQATLLNFLLFLPKSIDIYASIWYNSIRKEVRTLSRKRKKKSGNNIEFATNAINFITAILNLAMAILLIVEKAAR